MTTNVLFLLDDQTMRNDGCFCIYCCIALLGVSQALFRALKTKGNTPKYGIIYHSTFIGRAAAKNKGRISRVLANKCAIASRIDRLVTDVGTAWVMYALFHVRCIRHAIKMTTSD